MGRVEFITDPREFLDRAGGWLGEHPVLGSIPATVTERIVRGEFRPATSPWWAIATDGGEIVGLGMRTAPRAPWPAFLLPMPDWAAHEIARVVLDRGELLLGVNGALTAARTCAGEIARAIGGRVVVDVDTRLHELGTLRPPRAPAGRIRPAAADDISLVTAWFEDFLRDAAEQAGRVPEATSADSVDAGNMAARVAAGEVWIHDDERGVPVHLTAVSAILHGVARIGPVFTPRAHRGRGYDGATVAAVSERVLQAGGRPCLVTDQANPTSIQLYAALGFRPVADMVELRIEP